VKKTNKRRKPRNMVVYAMLRRFAPGRGAGAHGKRCYSRKIKHKGKSHEEG